MAQSPYQQLEQEFRRLHAFQGAASLLRWDSAVMMPRGSADVRGEQLAALDSESHALLTSPKVSRLIERAQANQSQLEDWQLANLREMRRERDHAGSHRREGALGFRHRRERTRRRRRELLKGVGQRADLPSGMGPTPSGVRAPDLYCEWQRRRRRWLPHRTGDRPPTAIDEQFPGGSATSPIRVTIHLWWWPPEST